MKRLLIPLLFLCAPPLAAQAPDSAELDSLRTELVRSRGFIRAAETQLSKTLSLLNRLDVPPAVDPTPELPGEPVTQEPNPPQAPPYVFSEAAARIVGPQIPMGEAPYAWYDSIQVTRGPEIALEAIDPATAYEHLSGYVVYYDLGLCLYSLYYRTRDPAHLALARQVVDRWVEEMQANGYNAAPRSVNLSGIMLRALDGRPELWPEITEYVRTYYPMWVGLRVDYEWLHYGIRDGGFALLQAAQLAAVHPDSAVRAEMRGYALQGARDYYARLQRPDGGWYYKVATMDSLVSQPFQVGLLLEGMIATHQLTGDTAVARAIVRGTDWLWQHGFDNREPWKAMYYFVDRSHTQTPFHPADRAGPTWNQRQLNSTCIHAFGYAYQLTGDAKYLGQGDVLLEATFNYDPANPRQSTGLAFYRGKEYSQSYRSSGNYLAWRLMDPIGAR